MALTPEQRNLVMDELFTGAPPMEYSMYEKILSDDRQRSRDNILQQIAASDPRGNYLGDMIGRAITGGTTIPSQEDLLRNRVLAGSMINTIPSVSSAFGGSRVDMFSGINAGFQNAGMMSGVSYGGMSGIQGPGALTDQLSRSVLNSLESSMYTAAGASRVGMTSGLSRTDIGQVVAGLGLRGGLNPEAEFVRVSTSAQARQLQASLSGAEQQANPLLMRNLEQAINDPEFQGATMLKQSSASVDRIRDLTEASTEAVAVMRSIIGPKGVPEVMDAIDSLLGEQVTTVGQARRAVSRMEQLKNLSATGVGTVQGLLTQQQGFANAFSAMGVSGPQAAMMGQDATMQMAMIRGQQQSYQAKAAGAGMYTPDFDPTITSAVLAQDAMALQTENPEVAAMLYGVQTAYGLNAGQREQIMAAITSINDTDLTGEEGQLEMESRINEANLLLEKYTGRTSAEILSTNPDVQRLLDPNMRRAQAGLNKEMIRRRTLDNFSEALTENDYLESARFGNRTEEQNAEFARVVFGNLSADEVLQIANGNMGNIDKVLADSGLSGEQKAAVRAQLVGNGVDAQFLKATLSTQDNEMLRTMVSRSTEIKTAKNMLDQRLSSMRFGGRDAASSGSFVEGLLGQTNFTDADVFEWMGSQGQPAFSTLGTMGDGGKIAWDLNALAAQTGMDADTLRGMASNEEGQMKILDTLANMGIGVGVSEGQVFGATQDQMTKARQDLDKALSYEKFKVLTGQESLTAAEKDMLDAAESGDAGAQAEVSALRGAALKKLRKRVPKLIDKAASGDEESTASLELMLTSGDAGVSTVLRQNLARELGEKREELSKVKDPASRKATKIQDQISKLEELQGLSAEEKFSPSNAFQLLLNILNELIAAVRAN